MIWYPGVPDFPDATPLTLSDHEHRTGIDREIFTWLKDRDD